MNKRITYQTASVLFLLAGSLFILFACGGGGGGTSLPGSGVISGSAVKGPVSGGTVDAFAISNGSKGSQLGSATTDAQGNFSMTIGSFSGSIMLQLNGGGFVDEATGSAMNMGSTDVMTAVISSISTSVSITGIQINPLTSMAQTRAAGMTGGMTDANINGSNTAVGDFFMVSDILHTQPMDPLVSGSGTGATQDMRNAGIAIAAISQEAKDLGMSASSGMVTAMMDDASDGVMNGMMSGVPISMSGMGGMMGGGSMQPSAGTSGLASAMTTFMTNTTVNKSGLTATDMQTLINKLNSSNGTIQ